MDPKTFPKISGPDPLSQVQEYEIKVSLPGHLVGSVPITNISNDFTKRLRAAAEATDSDSEVPGLDSLYKLGDIVAVSVVSAEKNENRYNLILSLAPSRTLAGRLPGI